MGDRTPLVAFEFTSYQMGSQLQEDERKKSGEVA